MNFLEEIIELSRLTTLLNQERLRSLSDDALAEKMAILRDSLLADPQIDGIVEHYCKVLRNLAEKADQEYRSYSETAYLLRAPANADRLREAIKEADRGNLPIFESA